MEILKIKKQVRETSYQLPIALPSCYQPCYHGTVTGLVGDDQLLFSLKIRLKKQRMLLYVG